MFPAPDVRTPPPGPVPHPASRPVVTAAVTELLKATRTSAAASHAWTEEPGGPIRGGGVGGAGHRGATAEACSGSPGRPRPAPRCRVRAASVHTALGRGAAVAPRCGHGCGGAACLAQGCCPPPCPCPCGRISSQAQEPMWAGASPAQGRASGERPASQRSFVCVCSRSPASAPPNLIRL